MTAAADPNRLDDGVLPRHYRLELVPDIDAGTVQGSVGIELDILSPCRSITLHALDLDLEEVVLRTGTPDAPGESLRGSVTMQEERETARLDFGGELRRGPAVLEIAYSGRFSERLVGMYSSTFNADGREQQLLVTQCESTHARRFVPCFDEPAFKATFSVSVVVPRHCLAVSNGPELGREPVDDSLDLVRFADTPKMSTYLLALVVGPLEATEPRSVAGRDGEVALRVVHPPGSEELCDFALEVADAALRFFEDWYDLPYPGEKLDLVAVPDFAFGAMENLGCVTFREVLLLVDPDSATPQELQRVADVINHEIAHMWFGNLVTMKWWNGIWLNEAFATFMEVSASDDFRPEWDVWTTFGLARAAAFDTDALVSTRPIEYEVVTAADAEGMFDILTYEKGCSVLRMLEQYLGAEPFREGIRAYLRQNAFGNTETTDLWDALEEATGEPVRSIMDAWIFTGGHPLVTVERDGDTVHLTQQRALADPGRGGDGDDRLFPVPMTIRAESDGSPGAEVPLLLGGEATWELPAGTTVVQPNSRGSGFYRTLMDTESRRALAVAGGPPLERFVLVDDTWFSMRSGHIELPDALDTVSAVIEAGEDDPAVWRRIGSACADLLRLAKADGQADRAARWTRSVLSAPADRFGSDPSPEGRTAEVAGTLLAAMGNAGGDAASIERARELFEDGSADPALEAAALEVVARHCDEAEHREIERRWREAGTPQEEQRHLSALVATDDPALMERAFGLLHADVRSQDAPYVFRRALSNPSLGEQAWRHVADNWSTMLQVFPSGSIPRMVEGVRSFTDPGLAREVEAFLAAHRSDAGSRQIDQHVEAMWATVAASRRIQAGASQRPW